MPRLNHHSILLEQERVVPANDSMSCASYEEREAAERCLLHRLHERDRTVALVGRVLKLAATVWCFPVANST